MPSSDAAGFLFGESHAVKFPRTFQRSSIFYDVFRGSRFLGEPAKQIRKKSKSTKRTECVFSFAESTELHSIPTENRPFRSPKNTPATAPGLNSLLINHEHLSDIFSIFHRENQRIDSR